MIVEGSPQTLILDPTVISSLAEVLGNALQLRVLKIISPDIILSAQPLADAVAALPNLHHVDFKEGEHLALQVVSRMAGPLRELHLQSSYAFDLNILKVLPPPFENAQRSVEILDLQDSPSVLLTILHQGAVWRRVRDLRIRGVINLGRCSQAFPNARHLSIGAYSLFSGNDEVTWQALDHVETATSEGLHLACPIRRLEVHGSLSDDFGGSTLLVENSMPVVLAFEMRPNETGPNIAWDRVASSLRYVQATLEDSRLLHFVQPTLEDCRPSVRDIESGILAELSVLSHAPLAGISICIITFSLLSFLDDSEKETLARVLADVVPSTRHIGIMVQLHVAIGNIRSTSWYEVVARASGEPPHVEMLSDIAGRAVEQHLLDMQREEAY